MNNLIKNPKVSIIVPIYNVESYLERCLTSLTNQTLQDIEIILVDDGSPDNCPNICDEYSKQDKRIKVIHKQNGGLGYARNSGIDLATGEYIAFVDSDDFIDTKMYETLYSEAANNNLDAVFCGFNTEIQKGKWLPSQEVYKKQMWNKCATTNFLLDMIACSPKDINERNYEMSVWHSIYKRNIININNIRFFSEREIGSEDLAFQIDFLTKAKNIAYLPNNFYFYCLNKSSLTKTVKVEKFIAFKTLHKIIKTKIPNKEGHIRADRFFIGYSRVLITHIIDNRINNWQQHVKNIIQDPIWEELITTYPYYYYKNLYQKAFYFFILKKKTNLLIKLVQLKMKIKK